MLYEVITDQIKPEASFIDDLGADSLDTVELIMAFEEEFKDELNDEIPESDAEKLHRITSYNVCYTKLLRFLGSALSTFTSETSEYSC